MSYKFVVAYGKILDSDLSGSQVYILQILEAEGAKKSSELAERLEISLPAVTNLTNKLVAKSYIERIVPEHDRRVTMLHLTPQGSDVLTVVNEKYATLTDALWTGFSDDEYAQLLSLYKKMVANLDQYKDSHKE
ncbi:MarR family transcriptional regulator [Brevibacillus fluminis]|uniref:MarR family transcriptional regulator n=2 Tax=Brevibacillus fluminis TaxID=511487 RepID=A0A3M8CV84_9BACL|nr:MarR family transcriptional regulator [Brevibacillus fluminis]